MTFILAPSPVCAAITLAPSSTKGETIAVYLLPNGYLLLPRYTTTTTVNSTVLVRTTSASSEGAYYSIPVHHESLGHICVDESDQAQENNTNQS
jgi:hypothetical protein